ncbi:ABC transporter ATP-binding protein [Oceanobacillus iheyensis HTE831]|uniref:ABC transporter ATP-binding protein n=1 Tax=Oceanobacillus iheyensis (strain DSM 14371 / CIP 107618 / JCM 11309 / KCTC 3954 / HTE831) TaxID=221109 RepID=Q8ET71_OCEIH|nr:ABC-F type ribosomal protection protein [Oceanobacillus iheyensis]BAC12347.1 ABC transporter ATP-binding protein [Oceanobacillus iheyensis HTE831]
MIACSIQNIKKMYGGNLIFERISLEINENERIGIVGRNGSGKSTLLRLMAKIEDPDEGKIHWRKNTEVGYLEQIQAEMNGLTVYHVLKSAFETLNDLEIQMQEYEEKMQDTLENVSDLVIQYGEIQERFSFLGGYERDAQIEKVCRGINIISLLELTFQQLSGGEKTKVALATILLKQPDFLLLDEPTNHLDISAVEWLASFLNDYPGTVVIVSHDRYFLDETVTKIIDLEDGEAVMYETNFSNHIKEKESRLLKEFQDYQEQQKKIKKMREAIKRLREWANRANPPNEGLHKRARNMERAIERMEKIDKPLLHRNKMGLDIETADRSGKDVVRLEDVKKRFEEHLLFENVNMHIRYQERVAIIGENGTGKSTLIKILLQSQQPDVGTVYIGNNVKIGYLSQHVFQDINPTKTVIEVFREQIAVEEGRARYILAQFLFYGYAVFRKVSELSGGEKMRLRLAQLMYEDINTLVLDEPTNHLDIDSREVLEEALENFQGTIIAVSHDRYFLDKIFRRIYWIEDKTVYDYDGNYSWAREKMNDNRIKRKEILDIRNNSKQYATISQPIIPVPSKNKEQENLLEQIEKLEQELVTIEGKMEKTMDVDQLMVLQKNKEEIEQLWEHYFLLIEE